MTVDTFLLPFQQPFVRFSILVPSLLEFGAQAGALEGKEKNGSDDDNGK